jgi:glycosyltransferase involved in cell wall biosynthesis
VRRSEDLSRHYASADVFCFPSLSETFGNVTLEAMASGIATVAFDYGAAREHLCHGAHGAAAAFGDETAFVRDFLATATSATLAQMGAAARQSVLGLHPGQVALDFAQLLYGLSDRREAA